MSTHDIATNELNAGDGQGGRDGAYLSLASRFTGHLAGLGFMPSFAVTRAANDVYSILHHSVRHGEPEPAARIPSSRWVDSLCYRMANRRGPRFAPAVLDEPGYTDSVLAREYGVRSYIGVPIISSGGLVVGSLCGWDTTPSEVDKHSDRARSWLGILEAQADILGYEFDRHIARTAASRDADWDESLTRPDRLTGLPDRSGWRTMLQREEVRASLMAEPLAIVIVDVDGAHTVRKLRRAGAVLAHNCPSGTRVARIGPKRFGLLCSGWTTDELHASRRAVTDKLTRAGLTSTVGLAIRHDHGSAEDRCAEISGSWHCGSEGAWHRAEHDLLNARRHRLLPDVSNG